MSLKPVALPPAEVCAVPPPVVIPLENIIPGSASTVPLLTTVSEPVPEPEPESPVSQDDAPLEYPQAASGSFSCFCLFHGTLCGTELQLQLVDL